MDPAADKRPAEIASSAMDDHDHAPGERRPDTLLITLTGKDRPGVSSAIFATLSNQSA